MLYRVFRYALWGSAFSFFCLSSAADSTPPIDIIQGAADANQRQLRQQKALFDQSDALPDRHDTQLTTQTFALPDPGGPCFHIIDTRIEDPSDQLPRLPNYARLNGQCADKAALATLLQDYNVFLQQQGFITSRVYIRPQNISGGQFDMVVVPGRLAGFEYHDYDADTRLRNAYPLEPGDIIQLRDLEQGLDNFNRPKSQSGKAELVPAGELGESILIMKDQTGASIYGNIGLSNSGVKPTGRDKANLSITLDNPLNINDYLNIRLSKNLFADSGSRLSKSVTVTYEVPYKNWLFKSRYNQYRYKRPIQGINQQFEIAGNSYNSDVGFNYLFFRNQKSRVYLAGGVAKKYSRNRIDGFVIPSQSRNLYVWTAGLRGDHGLGEGRYLDWSGGFFSSTHQLGGSKTIPGLADDSFRYIKGQIRLSLPFQNIYSYKTTLAVQHSDDELTGSEQFSAGGLSSVRGFHTDALYGNSGAYWRNEIDRVMYRNNGWTLTAGIALDTGYVKQPASIRWSQQHISGTAVHAVLSYGESLTLDATLAKALSRPDQFRGDQYQAHAALTYRF